MLDGLKKALKDGIAVPVFKDKGVPSTTFTFAYVSFVIAVGAELYFIVKGDPLASTATAIIFWTVAMVLYRLRRLDKVKFDLDDKSFELEGSDDKENKDG